MGSASHVPSAIRLEKKGVIKVVFLHARCLVQMYCKLSGYCVCPVHSSVCFRDHFALVGSFARAITYNPRGCGVCLGQMVWAALNWGHLFKSVGFGWVAWLVISLRSMQGSPVVQSI